MSKFLTIKHWQLFCLFIVLPIVSQILIIASTTLTGNPGIMFAAFPIMMILIVGFSFGWFYVLGTNLYKKLPEAVHMNIKRFKIFLIIPIVYMVFLCVFMFSVFFYRTAGGQPNPAIFAIIFPLHLFSMFCIFYCIYFIAKALKSVEWQKPVTFSDFAGEFFLIWFFPLGVWFIQPRINRLFDEQILIDQFS